MHVGYARPGQPAAGNGGRPGGAAAPVLERGGVYVFVRPDSAQPTELARMVADGRLRVTVSRMFGLDEAAEAHRLSETGHGHGKLVIVP